MPSFGMVGGGIGNDMYTQMAAASYAQKNQSTIQRNFTGNGNKISE